MEPDTTSQQCHPYWNMLTRPEMLQGPDAILEFMLQKLLSSCATGHVAGVYDLHLFSIHLMVVLYVGNIFGEI